MNIPTIKNKKLDSGFTIVELLIVIVVIGILAAIVIVAYNGVTQRATVAGYQTDANSIVKVAEAVNADTATGFPTTVAGFAPAGFTTAKLPTGVALAAPLSSVTADPTTQAAAGPTVSGGTKTYVWKTCGANTGLEVYYYDISASQVKTVTAGTGC